MCQFYLNAQVDNNRMQYSIPVKLNNIYWLNEEFNVGVDIYRKLRHLIFMETYCLAPRYLNKWVET